MIPRARRKCWRSIWPTWNRGSWFLSNDPQVPSKSIDCFLFLFIFVHFIHKLYRRNYRLQRDSNSDRQSRRRAHWPLDHPYGPINSLFVNDEAIDEKTLDAILVLISSIPSVVSLTSYRLPSWPVFVFLIYFSWPTQETLLLNVAMANKKSSLFSCRQLYYIQYIF